MTVASACLGADPLQQVLVGAWTETGLVDRIRVVDTDQLPSETAGLGYSGVSNDEIVGFGALRF